MEQADPEGKGGMSAVLGLSEDVIEEVLNTTNNQVEIANLNSPGQIVISGDKEAIDAVTPQLKEQGAKRVIPLAVSGPFHSSFMKPQAEKFREVLADITVLPPEVPLLHNVTAQPETEPTEIKERLTEQLYSKVRFEESIRHLLDHDEIDAFVEVGNKKVLSGLVKKIHRRARVFQVEDMDTLTAFVEWYKEDES